MATKTLVLLALLLFLVGCEAATPSDEENLRVPPTPSPTIPTFKIPTFTMTATPTPTSTPIPPLGSRQNPVPIGTTVEVRNEEVTDHWEITVLSTVPNATAMVLDEHRFNDPPEEGNQFYMVRIRVKYLGPDSTYFDFRNRLRTLGVGAVAYSTFNAPCTGYTNGIPDPLPDNELFTNGTIEGNVCWQIASTDADSLVMFLDPEGWSNENRTWFSLIAKPQSSATPTPTTTAGPSERVVPIATPTLSPTPAPVVISSPADLVEHVKGGVVKVEAGFLSGGSGFIFDVEETTAFVATNYHVIENALDSVEVTVNNARTYDALVLGWDADKDVAVLAICCSESFVILPWEEASPDVGANVVAVGYPRGGSRTQVTATTGEVTSHDVLSRLYDFIPHTAPLNPGNSGGPLFSMPDAKVLGINTAGGTSTLTFYAVPFQAVKEQIDEWRSQLVVTT